MFSFFGNKKIRIAESGLLHGFWDVHSHLLPGVDDGCCSLEESITVLRALRNLGFSGGFCTPHVMTEMPDNTPDSLSSRFAGFKEAVEAEMDFRLCLAAEYLVDENFRRQMGKEYLLSYDGSHVLIEISFNQIPLGFYSAVFGLCSSGYTPVLAHPERYCHIFKTDEEYRALKRKGCLFQMNLLSLSGHYGQSVQKRCQQLLSEGMYDFMGTDTHRLRHVELIGSMELNENRIDALRRLKDNNRVLFKE